MTHTPADYRRAAETLRNPPMTASVLRSDRIRALALEQPGLRHSRLAELIEAEGYPRPSLNSVKNALMSSSRRGRAPGVCRRKACQQVECELRERVAALEAELQAAHRAGEGSP